MNTKPSLTLKTFFPYRLTRLQAMVSDCVAKIYTGKFNLSRQQWRILAILADTSPLNAKQLGEQANIDKMPASRAIQKMLDKQLLIKEEHTDDKRSSLLRLSQKGEDLYQALAPMAQQTEQQLLSVLSPQELSTLETLMQKLESQAKVIKKSDG